MSGQGEHGTIPIGVLSSLQIWIDRALAFPVALTNNSVDRAAGEYHKELPCCVNRPFCFRRAGFCFFFF